MLSIEDIECTHWDYLVIGTGIGGATTGHALASAGKRVLFLEKGRAPSLHADTLTGSYPESDFSGDDPAAPGNAALLTRAGRCTDEVAVGKHRFVPLIGCGVGGSSALYGMAMERLFPADFEPRRHFPGAAASSLPDAWPLRYEDLAPYYQRAEQLYRVRGGRDPLRPDAATLPAPPPLGARNAELHAHFEKQGLHPYPLPMACEAVRGCECCQGYLCARGCKNDAGRICLEPAVREHGATLLDECQVLRLEATPDHVTGVVCRWRQRAITLRADCVIVAAGGLMTPALLLRSVSIDWPQGLANASGLVGRNLMRHYVDLYLVFTRRRGENRLKEIGLSDFYQADGAKLGTLQSFGVLPPATVLAATMARDVHDAAPWVSPLFALLRPLLPALLAWLFRRGVLLAAIMEDLPYADNRVVADPALGIDYTVHDDDRARLHIFRRQVASALKPYRFLSLRQAEKNSMLAHVCGTCRFGDDPATSVLDRNNRAHGLINLYVVDASFFPSSGGTNPALTIAANALRVADHLLGRDAVRQYPADRPCPSSQLMGPTTGSAQAIRHSAFRLSLHTRIEIAASPARIWDILTDFAAYADWNPALLSAAGQAVRGSELEVVIQWPGLKRDNYRLQVTAVEPERELRWLGHFGIKGLMDGDHGFIIEATGENSATLIQTENFSGLLIPLFGPWLRRNVLDGFNQVNAALKRRAENLTR